MAIIVRQSVILVPNRYSSRTFASNKKLWKRYKAGESVEVSDGEASRIRGATILSTSTPTVGSATPIEVATRRSPAPGSGDLAALKAPRKSDESE